MPLVVSLGGFGGQALAVRCGGSGDVTETRRVWHVLGTPARIGTPVIYEGYIYTVGIDGVAECLEAARRNAGNNAIWSSWRALLLDGAMMAGSLLLPAMTLTRKRV